MQAKKQKTEATCLPCAPVGDEKRIVCDYPGCDFRAKTATEVKTHKAFKHDIDVVWHYCDVPGCDFKAKTTWNVKKHKAFKHDIDVVWHYCDVPECDYKAKTATNAKTHKAFKHDIDVMWHHCDVPGCDYKAKDTGKVKKHKAFKHDINVMWHHCDVLECDFKAKTTGTVKKHKAFKHDINVVWHCCDVPGCDFKAKQSSNLTRHVASMHSSVYEARRKIQEERVRMALLRAGYTEVFSRNNIPPIGSFVREYTIDFRCEGMVADKSCARIDFVLSLPGGLVFLEVDENQHTYGYEGMVSCDMKRMGQVLEALAIEACDPERVPHVFWLRYNPNAWHIDGECRRVPKDDREVFLLGWLRQFESTGCWAIGYAFYDCDADGNLDVLDNEHYHPQYREVAVNLTDPSEPGL